MSRPYVLDAATLDLFRASCVYVAFHGDICVYVGQSACGLIRPLDRSHHRLKLCPDYTLLIIPVPHSALLDIEEIFIAALKPTLNTPTRNLTTMSQVVYYASARTRSRRREIGQ